MREKKMMIKLKRADEICRNFKGKRILVFGDVILDRYIFGDVSRISPEAPVPVMKVKSEEFRPGGACNVAANIDKLGAVSILTGFAGDDLNSAELLRQKSEENFILKSYSNRTIVKTRLIAQKQQIVRIDREDDITITKELQEEFRKVLKDIFSRGVDGIVISDYAKGSLNEITMAILKKEAAGSNIPIMVDPKPSNLHLYRGVTGITPNKKEAEAIAMREISSHEDVLKALNTISKKIQTTYTVITRGSEGISAREKGKRLFHLPAFGREVYDVTGAGDTVVSVILLALVSGASLKEAVSLANAAASIVIERVGTAGITVEEIRERTKFLLKK